MRRLLAAASLAVLGLALVVPVAFAHPPGKPDCVGSGPCVHYLAWGAKPQPATAPDGAQVYSTDEVVTAFARFADGVTSWDVVIRPTTPGAQATTCHEDVVNGGPNDPLYINCPWDTTRAMSRTLTSQGTDVLKPDYQRQWQTQDLGPSANGKYTIEVTVTNTGKDYSCGILTGCDHEEIMPHALYEPNSNPARWREVYVTNGVAQPTGVATGFDSAQNRITVSWARNPEPDISKYVVQEKVGDGKFSKGVDVPGNATTYDRVIDAPGSYQYKVSAVRPAPTKSDGAAAKQSGFVAAEAINIDQVAPPTSGPNNNPDSAANGGGDPGINLPSDTPSSTSPNAGSRGSAPKPSGAKAGVTPRTSGGSVRPTGATTPGGEAEGEGPDPGFSATLPFKTQDGSTDDTELAGGDEEQPDSMSKIVTVPRPHDARALLIPMAGGLLLFVFAMQFTYMVRRKPAVAHVENDFDDWMGL